MALIISSVKIKNTDIIIENVYARLSFTALANGSVSNVNLAVFENKTRYLENKLIQTDLVNSFFVTCFENQMQDNATIHELAKLKLEDLGYTVTIQL
jgi:hypothetical protein